jgi:tRNA(Ile)-lysidine synthase
MKNSSSRNPLDPALDSAGRGEDSFQPISRSILSIWPVSQLRSHPAVLAVSGGADSVALVRAIERLAADYDLDRGRFTVVYVDHGLRGAESARDASFVEQLAGGCGFPFQGVSIDGAPWLRSTPATRRGQGLESLARSARYRRLRQAARTVGARYIATAHTFDDHLETVIFRIVRGTGLRGLAGIAATRRGGGGLSLVRPLRLVRRVEIEAYLEHLGQPYQTDSMNLDLRFTRNLIRHRVLPQLTEAVTWPVDRSLDRLAELAAEYQRYLVRQTRDLWRQVQFLDRRTVCLDRRIVQGREPLELQCLFQRIWTRQRWPQQQMNFEKWRWLGQVAGRLPSDAVPIRATLPGAIRVEIDRGSLRLSRGAESG